MNMFIAGMEVEVVKKKIKNMHLYVLPPDGSLRVTVPHKVREDQLRAFVESRLDWIHKHQSKLKQIAVSAPKSFATGETIRLWGNDFVLMVLENAAKKDVFIDGNTVFLSVPAGWEFERRETLINDFYREQLGYELPAMIKEWEERLGVSVREWCVRNMKTRWGTCNIRKRRITFNLQLAKKGLDCLEYVVVHELAHLIVSNHSKEFKDVLSRHLPNWKLMKNKLKGL
ncbi:MAG: SprT family zinc-dependent metalloprotease [Bacillota bacterium]